ncbi:unnamed protein product [Didymodactylos carnosus]|uniref:Transmembrane protein 106 N-terminal domain-containing protein n=1 Tax=Didymodactylos carnosus TaxID=1234261 RepID=A0A814S0K3_9BILA|nr:unnamed protein product [Didymodactylos carnosus]CAF1141042.1 unnamed protein product [Didymodactylos carnosus]CAF3792783.1 unnamed protein product [Didymodactylos carnosus]CAF3904749.1 unnamed protein product [Didymodactylos carnosus]
MTNEDDQTPILKNKLTININDVDDELILNKNQIQKVQCPTCRGNGKIYRTDSSGLVVLIPLCDKRLKPKHTWIWILLTFSFCFIFAFTCIFFLLPRLVLLQVTNSLVIDDVNSTRTNSTFSMRFLYHFTLNSKNYIPVNLINVTCVIEDDLEIVGRSYKLYSNNIRILPRAILNLSIPLELEFRNTTVPFRQCQGQFKQMLLMKIETLVIYNDLLARSQSTSLTSYQYALCNKGIWIK